MTLCKTKKTTHTNLDGERLYIVAFPCCQLSSFEIVPFSHIGSLMQEQHFPIGSHEFRIHVDAAELGGQW